VNRENEEPHFGSVYAMSAVRLSDSLVPPSTVTSPGSERRVPAVSTPDAASRPSSQAKASKSSLRIVGARSCV